MLSYYIFNLFISEVQLPYGNANRICNFFQRFNLRLIGSHKLVETDR